MVNAIRKIINDNFILSTILLGLLLRLLLSFLPGFKIDVTAWFAWAERLNQIGLSRFYTDQIWTNYTPGYLYILWFLGFLKNSFNLSDNSFFILLKLPSIIADLILSLFIYKIISKQSIIWAKAALVFVVFNPVFIFNSSVWGQIDGLLTLLMITSIYFLGHRQLIFSSILFSLAFLIKPQAIVLLPVFIFFLIKNFSIKNSLMLIVPSFVITFLLSLPFFISQILGLPNLFLKMISDYPETSLFAYNFWGIVGFWISDSKLFNGLSYQQIGYIMLFLYISTIFYFYLKKKISIYALATLTFLGAFFLPTRVHERYLYPAIFFLIILVGNMKSKLLLVLTIILSFIHFLNLYYVYVYYNEIYLKLPKMLYNQTLYTFLDSNGKFMSLVSLILFLIIGAVIILSDEHFEKV